MRQPCVVPGLSLKLLKEKSEQGMLINQSKDNSRKAKLQNRRGQNIQLAMRKKQYCTLEAKKTLTG